MKPELDTTRVKRTRLGIFQNMPFQSKNSHTIQTTVRRLSNGTKRISLTWRHNIVGSNFDPKLHKLSRLFDDYRTDTKELWERFHWFLFCWDGSWSFEIFFISFGSIKCSSLIDIFSFLLLSLLLISFYLFTAKWNRFGGQRKGLVLTWSHVSTGPEGKI